MNTGLSRRHSCGIGSRRSDFGCDRRTRYLHPAGIGKKGFWQKDVSKGFPKWLERVEVPKSDGSVRHPLVNDERSLSWVANQNTITPHVWTSRVPKLYQPDICVFDPRAMWTVAPLAG